MDKPRPTSSPLPHLNKQDRSVPDNGLGGLPSLRPRPISWGERHAHGIRKAVGKDEFEKLHAMLDFKDSLIKEMGDRNQVLHREIGKQRNCIDTRDEEIRRLHEEVARHKQAADSAETRASSAEHKVIIASRERDHAVAELMRARRQADAEMSKQQVAWDMGKQHALQVMMDVKRKGQVLDPGSVYMQTLQRPQMPGHGRQSLPTPPLHEIPSYN
ncbi:hypothetical protein CYMTET_32817 [Cymbomonas tetramitiformis]|uniref:Uncharacterized protein n=1 Tax=Cymbomonas tetramitiformis TaxID=36881 RepID=A0AAE0KRU3_9CHLO|nr:hypothetical protein CYMTET_33061 [Cymbomonas tetramitiformis]KAK3258125.1 hypothetical protein CYMTET_32817 [Cymbomonas tetramitiformis]